MPSGLVFPSGLGISTRRTGVGRHAPAANSTARSSGKAVTPASSIFYTKVHNRLLGPLLAADEPPASVELRRALKVVDASVSSYVDRVRLKVAA